MAIFEKIQSNGEAGTYPKVPVEDLSAGLYGWASGRINREQLFNFVEGLEDLDGTDAQGNLNDGAEIDAIKAVYDVKPSVIARMDYITWVSKLFALAEAHRITKQQFITLAELN